MLNVKIISRNKIVRERETQNRFLSEDIKKRSSPVSVAGDTLQRALQLDPGSSSCGETAKPYGIKTLLLLVDGLENFLHVFFRLNFPSRRLN